jgi:acetyltransferase-like isoleucine patch superfamily enzyme
VPSYAPCLSSRSLQHSLRRDKFTIHSKAVVCQDVELKGDITIGSGEQTPINSPSFSSYHVLAGTIVHPKATIFAIAGPIVIGTGCIIEEGAIIVNRLVLLLSQDGKVADMNSGGERSCE